MNKSRALFATALTLLCVFAITGTGFALWNFNTDSRNDTASLNVAITQSTLAGDFVKPVVPSYVVFDEGISGTNSALTGISFYKSGSYELNGNTFNEQVLTDPNLSITFKTKFPMTADEVSALRFGIRVRATGGISAYLRKTAYYTAMKKQPAVPINDGYGEYIDLKAMAQTPNFDGSTNYLEKQNDDSTWELTFYFSTYTLNSFYTFVDGYAPSDMNGYSALIQKFDGKTVKDDNKFLIELWQGW